MGGIGISMDSQAGTGSPVKPLASVPQQVIDEIARQLGITESDSKERTRQALAAGKIDLPEDVDIKLTRVSTNTYCTIRKLPGGGYSVTSAGQPPVTIGP
jgi:hypothetical protein